MVAMESVVGGVWDRTAHSFNSLPSALVVL